MANNLSLDVLPHQSSIIRAPYTYPDITYFFLIGGYGCLAEGERVITDKGPLAIEDITKGQSVMTTTGLKPVLNVGRSAERAALYRLELPGGMNSHCTGDHRLLTPSGNYLRAAEVLFCGIISALEDLLPTIEAPCPLTHSEDAHRYWQKALDSLSGCLTYFHLCGEQLRRLLSSDLETLPSLVDALERIQNTTCVGARDTLLACIHAGRCASLLTTPHSFDPWALLAAGLRTGETLKCKSVLSSDYSQELQLFRSAYTRARGALQSLPDQLIRVLQPSDNPLYDIISDVQSQSHVSFLTYDYYYEMTVEGGNYITENTLVNHNCGKSMCGVLFCVSLISRYQGHHLTFGIGGATIKHLRETLIFDLLGFLDRGGIKYKHNSQAGSIVIGTITFIYFSCADPSSIFGWNFALCFSGDTLVTTPKGLTPISEIAPGDIVLTSSGPNRILAVHDNGLQMTVPFLGARATPDHPIAVHKRDKVIYSPLTKLTNSDIISYHSQVRGIIWKKLHDLESSGSGIRMDTIATALMGSFIDMYGSKPTDLFPRDMWFIIRILIKIIMLSLTSRLWMKDSIISSTITERWLRELQGSAQKSSKKTVYALLNCKLKPSALSKLAKYAERKYLELMETRSIAPLASWRESITMLKLATTLALRTILSSACFVAKSTLVRKNKGESSVPLSAQQPGEDSTPALLPMNTYCLTVENDPTFFANGVLAHNCILDETDELFPETVRPAVTAVQERCRVDLPPTKSSPGRSPFIAMFTTAQGLKGTYLLIQHFRDSGMPYFLQRASTKDNVYLSSKQVENLYKMYTEDEARAYLDGEFVNLTSGRVFAEFMDNKHVYNPFEVPQDNAITFGMDFNSGYNMAVVGIVREGIIYCIEEYHFDVVGDASRQMRMRWSGKIDMIPDASGKEIMSGFVKEFEEQNIHCIWNNTNPSVSERILVTNKLFRTNRLYVFPCCKRLIMALRTQDFDDKGNPRKGKGIDAPDHITDAFSYMVWHITHTVHGFADILSLIHRPTHRGIAQPVDNINREQR